MRHVDRHFVLTGIVLAIVGMGLGIVMGVTQDFALRPIHAHVNLVGWVTFMLVGLAYRVGLARRDGWAVAHFWIAAAGVAALSPGIYLAMVQDAPALAIVGAVLTLAAMMLFLANCLRALRP